MILVSCCHHASDYFGPPKQAKRWPKTPKRSQSRDHSTFFGTSGYVGSYNDMVENLSGQVPGVSRVLIPMEITRRPVSSDS